MDWSTLCPAAEADLRKVLATVHTRVPDMWSDVRCAQNDAFPFWVYASLNTAGPAADEVVVLSASFKWVKDAVQFSCDVASGEGQVLADGPVSILGPDGATDMDEWARGCLRKFHQLCVGHLELIRLTLDEHRA